MKETICSHCKNLIYDDEALLCHFCGESLPRASSGAMGKILGGKGGLTFALVSALVLLALLALTVR